MKRPGRKRSADFRKLADTLLSELLAESKSRPPRQPLYHYTSATGLVEILRSQKLWLTSAFHMNDPKELTFALDIVAELLSEQHDSDENTDKLVKSFCSVFSRTLQPSDITFWVACFSKNGDELGQWRAYGDDGKGFAIGLSAKLFRGDSIVPIAGAIHTESVNYDEKRARRVIASKIAKTLSILKDNAKRPIVADLHSVATLSASLSIPLRIVLLFEAIGIKHSAYKHEAEVRLIHSANKKIVAPHVQTRVRGSTLVSYTEAKFPVQDPGNIVEIVVGPCAHRDAESAIEALLTSVNLAGSVKIRRSNIPYRSA